MSWKRKFAGNWGRLGMKYDDSDLYSIQTDLEGTRYSLFDLANWKNGLAFKKINFSESGIPVIKIAELNNGIGATTAYTEQIFSEDIHLHKGDLLFSWSGNPQTSIDIFRFKLDEGWLNQHIFKVTPNEDIVDFDYFYFMMKFLKPRFTEIAINKQTTGLGHVTIADIKRLNLIVPTLDVQKQIVSLLKPIDDKIELNIEINDNLEQQAQLLFQSWFVDFEPFGGNMPCNWEIVSLDTIADFQNGYAFKSKELLGESAPNTYRVFKQGHINGGGGFNANRTKSWYPKSSAVQLEKYILHKGDILMAMTDMKDNVVILGNTAIMPIDNEYIVNQRVGLLRSKGTNGITYPFIYLLTNSKDFLTDLRSRANSGVQVNLSSTEIKASKTVLAPESINIEFSSIVTPMIEQTLKNQLENEKLSQLRNLLLPKLMSGEIDISDSHI